MFLVNTIRRSKSHIWDGYDSLCTMWSTGGLKQEFYDVYREPGDNGICAMCQGELERREQFTLPKLTPIEYVRACTGIHRELAAVTRQVVMLIGQTAEGTKLQGGVGVFAAQAELLSKLAELDEQVSVPYTQGGPLTGGSV
jgi:hypothetical protein